MTLLGKASKFVGIVAGKTAEVGIRAAGGAVAIVADIADKPDLAKSSLSVSKSIGTFVGETTKIAGEGLGVVLDKAIEFSTYAGGSIAESIADAAGADYNQKQVAKNVGMIAGGATVGLVTGEIIGTVATGITAATGVASTGVAISNLSGVAASNATLAALGGGALSAGGGGIAAGQALLTTITASSAAIGAIEGVNQGIQNKYEQTPLLEDNSKYIEADYFITED